MKKTLLFALCCSLFAACSTTVITEEDRALPDALEPAARGEETAPQPIVPGTLQVKVADPAQSFIAFTGEKPGIVKHEGKFNDFDVILSLENGKPSAIDVIIEIQTMETEDEGLTKHLLSPDFFDVAAHPVAIFTSSSIEPKNMENSYAVTGEMELHGVTKEITFDAIITDAYLTMETVLDRTAFSVGSSVDGLKGIAAEVPVEAKIVLVKEE